METTIELTLKFKPGCQFDGELLNILLDQVCATRHIDTDVAEVSLSVNNGEYLVTGTASTQNPGTFDKQYCWG